LKQQLEKTQALFASIVNSSDDAIISKTPEGIINSWNAGAEKMFGYSSGEIIGEHISILIPPPLLDEENRILLKILQGKTVDHYETRRIRKDGQSIQVSLTISPLKDSKGNITGASKIMRNLTEQRVSEVKLAASEERFHSLLDNMLEGVLILDFNWIYTYVNIKLVKQSRYTREELIGHSFLEKHPHVSESILFSVMQRCMLERGSEQLETEFTFQGEKKEYFEFRIQPAPEGLFVFSIDITERKNAETIQKKTTDELKKSEKLFRSIALNLPKSLVIVMGKDHRFLILEGDIMERMGYKRQDYEGKHPLEVSPKENYEASKPLYDRVFAGEAFSVERSSPMGDFIVHFVPVKDETGSVESALILALDISEIKKAQKEIESLNKNLEQKVEERTSELATVNKELESFSYSVSHDLRAPLRGINSYTRILEEEYLDKLDEEGKDIIGVILRNSKQMGELIDDLLAFSRLGRKEINCKMVPMELLVNELTNGYMTTPPGKNIVFTTHPLPPAFADHALIRQVWINLISNAVKYSGNKTQPVIEIGSYQKDEEHVYYVKDNGVGFDMNYYHKLFGVFQRLHSQEEFEGTGVGLATTQRIILKHNGTIWAEATINEGAAFYFSLPNQTNQH
jgi:PAS domain S-box-containing protein